MDEPVDWTSFWTRYPAIGEFVTGAGWEMGNVDRAVIEAFASLVKPPVAIDVGTFEGGSARALLRHAELVVSIDEDPARDPGLDRVEFVAGTSWEVLPDVLERHRDRIGLVLLDADHTPEGVARELEALLAWRPGRGVAVLIHDVAQVRELLQTVDWMASPWVRGHPMDFSPPAADGWGGIGFTWMDSEPRDGPFAGEVDGVPTVISGP